MEKQKKLISTMYTPVLHFGEYFTEPSSDKQNCIYLTSHRVPRVPLDRWPVYLQGTQGSLRNLGIHVWKVSECL